MSDLQPEAEKTELLLSPLRHTWILDLDGTLVKHNGYHKGNDCLLKGAKEFLSSIAEEDMVLILTSRSEEMRKQTEEFLREQGVRYDEIIFNVPYGERILVNDDKPSGLQMAIAVRKDRDADVAIKVRIDEDAARKSLRGTIEQFN